jgi:hypothetical protein
MKNGAKKRGSSRPLTILDCMVVVAAIALGQAGWIALRKGAFYRGAALNLTPIGLDNWVQFLSLFALALSWAVVALSFRGPDLDRGRWASRPGFVACFAIVVASAARWLIELPSLNFVNSFLMSFWPTVFWSYLLSSWPPRLAPAVLACWLALWIGRRWRFEAEWVDVLGCCLGVFTLVLAIVGAFVAYNG